MGHLAFRTSLGARNTKLIHAAVDLSGATDDLIELLSIEIDLLGLLARRWSRQRCLAQRECSMNSLREFHGIAMSVDVHVHHARRFVQQVIVERRNLYAFFFQFRHYRTDFVFGQNQISHHHRFGSQLSKRDPRTEDRKSTRLNSSHVAISYAVFCLKKKI